MLPFQCRHMQRITVFTPAQLQRKSVKVTHTTDGQRVRVKIRTFSTLTWVIYYQNITFFIFILAICQLASSFWKVVLRKLRFTIFVYTVNCCFWARSFCLTSLLRAASFDATLSPQAMADEQQTTKILLVLAFL